MIRHVNGPRLKVSPSLIGTKWIFSFGIGTTPAMVAAEDGLQRTVSKTNSSSRGLKTYYLSFDMIKAPIQLTRTIMYVWIYCAAWTSVMVFRHHELESTLKCSESSPSAFVGPMMQSLRRISLWPRHVVVSFERPRTIVWSRLTLTHHSQNSSSPYSDSG